MATVGTQWLMDNAPSELTHPWQMYLVAKKQNDEMASLLADINEYCQANGIGIIGDSASKALMTHHQALLAQVENKDSLIFDIMMDKKIVRELALANGFKLKEQPDGTLDLNPYVYEFAAALAAKTGRAGFIAGADALEVAQILGSDFDTESAANQYAEGILQEKK
jgi:hypothetical protein